MKRIELRIQIQERGGWSMFEYASVDRIQGSVVIFKAEINLTDAMRIDVARGGNVRELRDGS